MSWEQGDLDLPPLDADLDLIDFDLDTFEGDFPLDVRVEEISEVSCAVETKTDERLPSLSITSLAESASRTDKRQKRTKPKKARKFIDLSNEDGALREQDVLSQYVAKPVDLESKMTKVTHPTVPRPVSTDLRDFYPRMFMNSINSADIMTVQSYFNTFMTGPCTFIAKHQINRSFGMPQQMTAVGPEFFSHYLLGIFLIFPDMVLKLLDSHVVIGPDWLGTKIVMNIEVNCTKIYDMAKVDYAWVPQVENLSDVYQSMSVNGTTDMVGSSAGDNMTSSHSGADRNGGANEKNTVTSRNDVALTRIPQTYVERLLSEAVRVEVPEPLVSKDIITLYLDERNCMKHVVVDVVQLNKPKRRAHVYKKRLQ